MSSDDDLFNFDIPLHTPEPKQDVTLHPETPGPAATQSSGLPSATTDRRELNWWAVLAISLVLFIGIYAFRSFLPAGGGSGVDGLHVLIVEEKDDRIDLPSEQRAILTSQVVREWCDEHCINLGTDKDPDPAARVFDQDENLNAPENAFWHELMMRKRSKLPWIYAVGGDGKQVDQPLPKNVDDTIELLEAAK